MGQFIRMVGLNRACQFIVAHAADVTGSAGGGCVGGLMGQDEVAHLWVHGLAPAAAAEDAVVACALHFDVLAGIFINAGAQVVGSTGLARAGDIVQLAFDGQQSSLMDVLRAHQFGHAFFIANFPGAVDQLVFLEDGRNRFEVIVRIHVEHGVVLVIELAVVLGAGAVTLDQVLEVVVMALGMTVGVHGHKARVLQEAWVHTATSAGVVVRYFVDDVGFEPFKAACFCQIVHGSRRATGIDRAAHHGHGQRCLLTAAGHQRHSCQNRHGRLANAHHMALTVAALQVANEFLHIVHIVVEVEFTFGQRHSAGVLPVSDIDLVAAQHALHGIAQQGGVVTGQRCHDQHHGLAQHGFQRSGIVGEALETAQLAKWFVHFHAFADGDINAVDFNAVQVEAGLFVVLAQAVHQVETCGHALSQRQLTER